MSCWILVALIVQLYMDCADPVSIKVCQQNDLICLRLKTMLIMKIHDTTMQDLTGLEPPLWHLP